MKTQSKFFGSGLDGMVVLVAPTARWSLCRSAHSLKVSALKADIFMVNSFLFCDIHDALIVRLVVSCLQRSAQFS